MRFDNQTKKELEIALKIKDESPRLSLVILDNLVELKLYDIIQENAMFDYLDDSSVNAKKRINLYSFFDEKLQYAIKKNVLSKDFSELLKIFHKLRNQLYHNGRLLNIGNELVDFYYHLVSDFILDTKASFFEYSNSCVLSVPLRKDLEHRFVTLKKNIRISCVSWESEEEIPLSDEEINGCLDHIFSNYGEHIVEKSQLDRNLKLDYISKFLKNQEAENLFFQIERLYEIIKEVDEHKWDDDLIDLQKWFKIDKEISFYEEVIEWYIVVAC